MDLSIDYVCPRCQRTFHQSLRNLVPGRRRECPACGTATVLTMASLENLKRSLGELEEARPAEAPAIKRE